MISFKQFRLRRFFLKTTLTILLTTALTFNFVSAPGSASTSLTQLISQLPIQIATMNQVEAITKNIQGKVQEVVDNVTGDSKDQISETPKQVDAKAYEGINDSIQNPDYQPGGKTKQAQKEATEQTKNIESQVYEAYN